MNGSKLALGVRNSKSESCHTCSGLSFTSQVLKAQSTLVTLSSTLSLLPKIECMSLNPAKTLWLRLVLLPIPTVSQVIPTCQTIKMWQRGQKIKTLTGFKLVMDRLHGEVYKTSQRRQPPTLLAEQHVYCRERSRHASNFQQAGFE